MNGLSDRFSPGLMNGLENFFICILIVILILLWIALMKRLLYPLKKTQAAQFRYFVTRNTLFGKEIDVLNKKINDLEKKINDLEKKVTIIKNKYDYYDTESNEITIPCGPNYVEGSDGRLTPV